jgi:hypothetical protein
MNLAREDVLHGIAGEYSTEQKIKVSERSSELIFLVCGASVPLPVVQLGSEEISIGSTSHGDSTSSPYIPAFDGMNYSALPGSSLSCRIRPFQAAAGLVNLLGCVSARPLSLVFGQGIKGHPNAAA